MFKNSEGYADLTAGVAMSRIIGSSRENVMPTKIAGKSTSHQNMRVTWIRM